MAHKLREDKTCLNCHFVVPGRFCANCGQENTEQEKSFFSLFTHFIEDLVHYDSSFRKTVSALLFRPGHVTVEYLSGRRKKYVAPVKLYIFINFVAFFLLTFTVSHDTQKIVSTPESRSQADSLWNERTRGSKLFTSVRELDSAQALKPQAEKMTRVEYWFAKRTARVIEQNTPAEFMEKLMNALLASIPKALFFYMPIFALALWVFQSKKRWFYFDHGIFTLHYFSFILLTFSVFLAVDFVFFEISSVLGELSVWLFVAMMLWWFFYFFRAHRTVYNESRLVSGSKGLGLFVINLALMALVLIAWIFYALFSIK